MFLIHLVSPERSRVKKATPLGTLHTLPAKVLGPGSETELATPGILFHQLQS